MQDIGPLDVRDYLEAAKGNGLSPATLKQHMAAIRMLFDHLVTGAVLEHNPALSVKAPRQKLGKGKTPVLTAEEAGELLRSIKTDDVLGLRDLALIGVMVFTFARVSAACGLNVADIFHQRRRLWVRLHAGAEGAEALSGLARAFFYAGARALLVSHWSVYSDATVKLITGAVNRMAADKDVGRAEAMRQSMLALIDKGKTTEAHPSYWAPFVVVGEAAAAK